MQFAVGLRIGKNGPVNGRFVLPPKEARGVTIKLRRVLLWILVIFALYAVFRSPNQAADVTRSAFDGLSQALSSVGAFFDALLAS